MWMRLRNVHVLLHVRVCGDCLEKLNVGARQFDKASGCSSLRSSSSSSRGSAAKRPPADEIEVAIKGLKKWFELRSTPVRRVLALFGADDGQGDSGIRCGGEAERG